MAFQPHTLLHIHTHQESRILHMNPWACATKSTLQWVKIPANPNYFIQGSHDDIYINLDSHSTNLSSQPLFYIYI